MGAHPRRTKPPAVRAEETCGLLRSGRGSPARAIATLTRMGAAAVPAVAALLRERGAGYSFAVRILTASDAAEATDALREAAADPGSRECDRLEAAQALADRGDPSGLRALRDLAARGTALRAAAYYCLRGREGGLADEDLVLGPFLDDPEVRPLAVEDLRARGIETTGSLDDAAARARFREGWRAGVRPARRTRRRR